VSSQLVVPVYNEGENVRVLYDSLVENSVDFKKLRFVYDLDEDSSLPFIIAISASDERVVADKNCYGPGVLNALRWGFSRSEDGPVIVLMGDNSDKLSIIPRMIELWHDGATVVSPSRYMPGGKQHGGGLLKSGLSRLAGKSLRLLGFPTADPTNNFKLYDGAWLRRQEIESTGGFELALELCYKAFVQRKKIVELPTEWWDRERGQSRFRLLSWIPRYLRWYFKTIFALFKRRLG